jgi:hypothetical protein
LQELIGWSPSPEAIETLAIGLGQRAPDFMETQARLANEGDVLVVEVDGKAAPMVTDAELAARRRPRRKEVGCKCQGHRRQQRGADICGLERFDLVGEFSNARPFLGAFLGIA